MYKDLCFMFEGVQGFESVDAGLVAGVEEFEFLLAVLHPRGYLGPMLQGVVNTQQHDQRTERGDIGES